MSKIIPTDNPNVFRVEGSFINVFAFTNKGNLKMKFNKKNVTIYKPKNPENTSLIPSLFEQMKNHDGEGFSSWYHRNVRDNPELTDK